MPLAYLIYTLKSRIPYFDLLSLIIRRLQILAWQACFILGMTGIFINGRRDMILHFRVTPVLFLAIMRVIWLLA